VNAKHRKTLAAIFARPTLASIPFADIEALIETLGGTVTERKGSRVKIELKGEEWRCHRPHPWEGSEAISGGGSARVAGTIRSTAMNSMSYKGYTARVEFDERDNIFVGRILGVRNIISFHGETVAELKAELKSAVDDYLAECEEQGLKPEKPASGKLLLRVPPEIHGKALVVAQAAGKSLNQWATEVLQRAVETGG
jgi:predicted HicB family RNase H-like nuclease